MLPRASLLETITPEQSWRDALKSHLGPYYSRTIVTEYGAPMSGTDFSGPINGNVFIAYMLGVPNQMRDYGMGSCYWAGLEGAGGIAKLNGTGTNLSLTVNNASGLARIQAGWGM